MAPKFSDPDSKNKFLQDEMKRLTDLHAAKQMAADGKNAARIQKQIQDLKRSPVNEYLKRYPSGNFDDQDLGVGPDEDQMAETRDMIDRAYAGDQHGQSGALEQENLSQNPYEPQKTQLPQEAASGTPAAAAELAAKEQRANHMDGVAKSAPGADAVEAGGKKGGSSLGKASQMDGVAKSAPGADAVEAGGKKGGSSLGKASQQAVDQAKKKAQDWLKKNLSKQALRAFWVAYWPWILGILAAIIIIIILIAIFAKFFGGNRVVAKNGKTIHQQVDPLVDAGWLEKLLLYSGNSSVGNLLSDTSKKQIIDYLNQMQSSGKYTDLNSQITKCVQDITNYSVSADSDQSKGKALVQELQALVTSILKVPPIPSGTKVSSIGNVTGYNANPHWDTFGCSTGSECEQEFQHKSHPAHTYQQYKLNSCDAVDLAVGVGQPVHAILSGQVVKSDLVKSGIWVESDLKDPNTGKNIKYILTYAHIQSSLQNGATVTSGDVLGTTAKLGNTSGDIVHFELSADGKCVVNTSSENESGKAGQDLWNKMKAILGL